MDLYGPMTRTNDVIYFACFQTSMNAGIHRVHSCAETLLAHFSVLVDQDLSFSQTRSRVKVKKRTLHVFI